MRLFRSIARPTAASICSEVPLASAQRNEGARGELINTRRVEGRRVSGPADGRQMKGGRIPLRMRLVSAVLATTVLFSDVCAEGPAGVPAPQPLADVLEAFAKSTGYQLVYRADVTAGLTSTGAPPNTPPLEALRQLLRGTDLEFSFVNSRTIVILKPMAGTARSNSAAAAGPHRPDTRPEAGATGRDANPDTSDGRDQNPNHRGLFARIAEVFAVCGSASMAGTSCTPGAATLSRSGLEEVVVT